MVFPSLQFAFFFPVVLIASWALMPRPRVWKPFILVASYVFYAAASVGYAALLAGITLANQAAAVLIARARTERARKALVAAIVAVDLGALGVFKYYGFFAEEIARSLDVIGLGMPLPLLELALPIGLSFITFQAISYVVDVKRGLLPPASTIDFALYLSFFPHVVAGPIVRAREFIPQLATPRDPRNVAVGAGVVLIALGLVKKVAIADFLARSVVDDVFAAPQAYAAPDVALAAYAYAAQIYCDFSGYTDIAIGLALLLGFVFPQNFNSPYRALSFSRLLAPLAHDAVALPARLPLHPARRQPRRALEDGPQPDDHDGAGRPVARRGVGLRAVGRAARDVPRDRAPAARQPAAGCPSGCAGSSSSTSSCSAGSCSAAPA